MIKRKSKNEIQHSNIPLVGKVTFWFAVCNYVLKGVSLITIPIYTRLIIPEEYGILAELTAMEEIILMLSNWDISVGAYLKGLYKYDDVASFTTASQLFVNITTVGLYLICLPLFWKFGGGFGFTPAAFLLMFMQHMIYPSYRLWLTRRQCEFAYKPATIATLSYGLLTGLVPFLAILIFGRTAEIKFCSTMAISGVFCIPFFLKNCRYVSLWKCRQRVADQFRFILRYQLPILISSLSLVMLTQLDRIIISQMVGHKQTAYYGVACSITSGVIILYSSIGQAMLPWKYKKLKEEKYENIRTIESRLLIAAATVTFIFIMVVPEVMKILFPDSYYEAVLCIPALAVGAFFNYLSSLYASVETYYEQTKYCAFGMVFCSGMNILLNFLLIDHFGYSVCAYTTAVCYLVYALIHSFFVKKTIRRAGLNAKLYNIRCIVLTCSVLLLMVFFEVQLYPYPLFRYGLICILMFVLVGKRRWVMEVVGSFREGKG